MAIKFNQSDLSWALKNFPGIAGVFDDDLALLQFSTMAHRIDQDAPWWKDLPGQFQGGSRRTAQPPGVGREVPVPRRGRDDVPGVPVRILTPCRGGNNRPRRNGPGP